MPRAKKRFKYNWVAEIMIDDWVQKGYTKLNMVSAFGKWIRSLNITCQSWTFEIERYPKAIDSAGEIKIGKDVNFFSNFFVTCNKEFFYSIVCCTESLRQTKLLYVTKM